ncbi:MAG TPA: glycine--tRNA ligase subunit beta [Candidatus Desulfobacillus sp.]|nr:glycine--tRNA ligase subunit beta [Candidatus Desulfobacillus sp.]
MAAKNLLVELLVEELPPKALKKLGESFIESIAASLEKQGLVGRDALAGRVSFASPRRLAIHLPGVLPQAEDGYVSHKLMPVGVGLDAGGKATPALLKKLASLGADASEVPLLRRGSDGKVESLFLDRKVSGVSLAEGLQKALEAALASLPIPKVMSYQLQDGWSSVRFVRPAHKLVALHGADIVPVSVLGLQAGRETQGHRFEAKRPVVTIEDADSYARQMEAEGAVIAGFNARRAEIEAQLKAAAAKEGLQPLEDDALLDEVTALVERPNVLTCRFEEAFLDVPQECLILTMKANQKYFPLLDGAGRLTHKFLVVANIHPDDPSAVIGGNERVVRPRLADAKFFYDQDRKRSLMDRIPDLDKVVYHSRLGSQGERSQRVAAIARAIAAQMGGRGGGDALARQADRAAMLAKADLLSGMVGEFPELQGVMGRYYALHDGEAAEVADAIEDHYKPRFAGDSLPRGLVGLCLALADKLETLAGLFGIGQQPTGDKDPFALRRHALGVIRILVERGIALPLPGLIEAAFAAFPAGLADESRNDLSAFILERFAGLLREQGYSPQEVDAVLSLAPARLDLVPRRLDAVRAFGQLPEAASLAAANKRVGNILKKAGGGMPAEVDATLLQEPAEAALSVALTSAGTQADDAYVRGDYAGSLKALAALKQPVDDFFDRVMVNVDDAALRGNRLALLARLHAAMNRVADLSRLSA